MVQLLVFVSFPIPLTKSHFQHVAMEIKNNRVAIADMAGKGKRTRQIETC